MEERGAAQTLVGILDRITFQNPETHFLVGRFVPEGQREPIPIVGSLYNVEEGQTLKLWGDWDLHREYGMQFRVEAFLLVEPTSAEGMERFLAASVKGVGRATARRIVRAFGAETFRVLDENPERLREVPKVSRKVVAGLKASWAEHKAVRDVMVFLHGLGISPGYAERIFRTYGFAAAEVIRDNPYRLAMDVRGIGFRIADGIAMRAGLEREDPKRADAGVVFALEELAGEGHTGYPLGRLLDRAAQLLGIGREGITAAVQRLVSDGSLRQRELAGEPFFQRPRYERAEGAIARDLARILAGQPRHRLPRPAARLRAMERETGVYLDDEQRAAVEAALGHKALILTGGPGTGKTTIIRFILGLMREARAEVALAAPTGKAAKRMNEATGHPASTIHRLLEAGGEGFLRHAGRPIEADVLIVDESSMIDTLLMAALLAAVPAHARLVLVGDVDQLPSVGPGMVLEDLIASGHIPVVRLERIHRQSARSRITANAHRVRKGDMPELAQPPGEALADFYFMAVPDAERIVARVRELVTQRIPERFGLDPHAVQVITPMHKGLTGVGNLNRALQDALNPAGAEIAYGETRFRVGDRVMQTRNDYDKVVFNGDMGHIRAWDPEEERLRIAFDDREVAYERKELDQVALAYAITVHKAQGSEYPAVVLPFTTHHAVMLQRNLLYTALTRGRRLVVILGTEKAVGLAVRNARRETRYTGLRPRFAGALAAPQGSPDAHAAAP